VRWVSSLKGSSLGGVQYALFGCGDPGWAETYQAIPKLCDTRLIEAGANRLLDRGEGNVSLTTLNEIFFSWTENLWKKISEVRPIYLSYPSLRITR
jgi:cytochrome P450 / NADPH-cytochrome P450 reductase